MKAKKANRKTRGICQRSQEKRGMASHAIYCRELKKMNTEMSIEIPTEQAINDHGKGSFKDSFPSLH